MKQYSLFDDINHVSKEETIKKNNETSIIILTEKASKKDIQNKNLIDKKISKINTLEKQIEKTKEDIQYIKKRYQEKVSTIEKTFLEVNEKFVLKLFERYKQNGFSVRQKDIMSQIILEEISELMDMDYVNDRLIKISEELHSEMYNDSEEENEEINSMFKDFFNDMNVDLDFDFKKMQDNEYMKEMKKQFQEQQKKAEKNEKEQQQQLKVKTTDKDFQKLYKKLVKKTHPDLVTCDKEKEEREILMKKLSEAWEHRNYYQLLILQKEIEGEINTDTFVQSNQLTSLLEQLTNQINELENQKYQLKSQFSEDFFYYKNFYSKSKKTIEHKIDCYIFNIEQEKKNVQNKTLLLKSKESTKRLLKEIYRTNMEYYENDFFI